MARKYVKQNRRSRAASRVSQIQSKLDNGDSRRHVHTFLEQYILCEIIAKELVVGYKDAIGDPIAYSDVEMHVQTIRAAFKHYGLGLSNDVVDRIFVSKKTRGVRTARGLRNALVHSMDKRSITAVDVQYSQLMADMQQLLDAVQP